MDKKLEYEVNRFYAEMENKENTDVGTIACKLVPQLVSRIATLERQLKQSVKTQLSNIS